ncbi:MAG: hypothetical protein KC643_31025 [Nitrospira sp.]|nr:hypothetical protein [Nitrospira sp.]
MSQIAKTRAQDFSYEWFDDKALRGYIRLGGTASQIVKRLLFWVNRDYKELNKEDWEHLRYEIAALAELGWTNPTFEDWSKAAESWLGEYFDPEKQACYLPYSENALEFLQIISSCIEQLANKSSADLGPISAVIRIYRQGKEKQPLPKFGEMIYERERITDKALYTTAKAIQHCGGLVEVCPECSLYFLLDRINQKYCSTTCSSRVTTRRSREKKKAEKLATQKKKRAKTKKSTGKKI